MNAQVNTVRRVFSKEKARMLLYRHFDKIIDPQRSHLEGANWQFLESFTNSNGENVWKARAGQYEAWDGQFLGCDALVYESGEIFLDGPD